MIRNTATEAVRSPLPLDFYRSAAWYERSLKTVFTPAWQFLAGPECRPAPGEAIPLRLLPGSLDEPLLLTRDADGREHILSNVCTHRGHLLQAEPGTCRQLVCPYHGRSFDLQGHCLRQPGLGRVADFPNASDHLRRPDHARWQGLRFVRLGEGPRFADWIAPVAERTGFLPWDTLRYLPEQSRDYHIRAHWALYCDNYLEGLHIPFVHPTLREALDLEAYPVYTFPGGSLQIGLAGEGQPAFDLPDGHPDAGSRIYAWYFWLYPNIMCNVYPWGLSLNVVEPLGPAETRVRFLAYAFADQAGGPDSHALHATELEDEEVVERVQTGTSSRLFHPGRLLPDWEKAVLHFHQLLLEGMG